MRILLDENLDWRLKSDLPGHEVESVPLIGWAGLKNGALLAEAEKRFEVLLTMDSNMLQQQNLAKFRIAIIALKARSNRLQDTRLLMPKVLVALSSLKVGTLTFVFLRKANMALTRDYKGTVIARIKRDPKFARALRAEATKALSEGERAEGQSMLRDLKLAKPRSRKKV